MRVKKSKEKVVEKTRVRRMLDWLVDCYLPGFHIAANPPKGRKRVRRVAPEPRPDILGSSI